MTEPGSSGVTRLLLAWRKGDAAALDQLTPIVYSELRQLARRHMEQERVGHVLQTTALVHEAYLRLVDQSVGFENRRHFFGVAARLMRQVLVDHARRHNAAKRGGGNVPLSLDEMKIPIERADELIRLDDALEGLSRIDARKARIFELRYFGGLTIEETCALLDISHATVERDTKLAKAWLHREMARARA